MGVGVSHSEQWLPIHLAASNDIRMGCQGRGKEDSRDMNQPEQHPRQTVPRERVFFKMRVGSMAGWRAKAKSHEDRTQLSAQRVREDGEWEDFEQEEVGGEHGPGQVIQSRRV